MPVTCPAGHLSTSRDYCDRCGAIIQADPAGPALDANEPPPVPDVGVISPCPDCGAPARVDEAVCQACGIEFSTGEVPTHSRRTVPPGTDGGADGATGTEGPASISRSPDEVLTAALEAEEIPAPPEE